MKRVMVQDLLDRAQGLHKAGELDQAEKIYHEVLTHNIDNFWVVFLMAQIQLHRKNFGMAIYMFRQVVKEKPDFVEAWNNLGCALKCVHADEPAEFCFKKAFELDPTHYDFPSNISGIYVNRGQPDKVIEWADKAIALAGSENENDPGITQAKWHKAMALLEKKEFTPGWDYHEARLAAGSGCDVATRNYAFVGMTPWWNGNSLAANVVIHGEQGLGDEIMFSSCIPDAQKMGVNITFECNPRIEGLMRRSFPNIVVFGTHKTDGKEWLLEGEEVDYKCAVGSLPKFFRRDIKDFPGTPFLVPHPEKARHYRERLQSLGPRPKIGIAWQGGVIKTRVDLRSVFLSQLKPLLEQEADFISLQYTQMAPFEIEEFFAETGIVLHHWPEAASGKDMDDQAALVANLDLVITVCQTVNHVAGGLGIPCWVLTPKWPSWREGIHGEMPWYNSVKMYRQTDTWEPVIEQVSKDLCSFLKTIENKTESYIVPVAAMG